MACDLETTIESACESGIGKVQDPTLLLKVIAQLLCEISSGGIVAPSNLLGSGSPVGVVTPTAAGQFYSDTTNDVLWQAFGPTDADWHQWI